MEQTTGSKRKRDTSKFYSVHAGHNPGIYNTWEDCLKQVKGHKGATYKAFDNLSDAEKYLQDPSLLGGKNKFYAVRNGRKPGIYRDWPTAQEQIKGWSKPRYKCFATEAEAQQFMTAGQVSEYPDSSGKGFAVDELGIESKKQRTLNYNNNNNNNNTNDIGRQGRIVAQLSQSVQTSQEMLSVPLPSGMEDGFDNMLVLDYSKDEGGISTKSGLQASATKLMPRNLHNNTMLSIYTDGSTLGNGRRAALGGVGVYFGPMDSRNISEPLIGRQTNQRAELQAILRALEAVPKHRDIEIISDSQYAIHCVTKWSTNWLQNGWKTSAGKAVENRDLVENILEKMEQRSKANARTLWKWIKGHASVDGNEEADKLARQGAARAR